MIAKGDFYGIFALIVASMLLMAVGNWPYGYFQFVRFATCAFSIAIVYRPDRIDAGGWLLFAVLGCILFNPIIPVRMGKGNWADLNIVFAIGYAAYGLQSFGKTMAKAVSVIVGILIVGVMSLTFYVNRFMPHGTSYATGEIVCQYDDRGSCGEERKEDVSGLAIPHWAKFLREYFVGVVVLLIFAGAYAFDKAKDDDAD